MPSDLILSDPAIINATLEKPKQNSDEPRQPLEPTNALSKLLDSAMANAAKESSPDVRPDHSAAKHTAQRAPSFLFHALEAKLRLPNVYSIERLLELRSDPAVAEFDLARLPAPSFWLVRAKNTENNNQRGGSLFHGSPHQPALNLRKNRRNNNNNNNGVQNFSSGPLKWERAPAGFLKRSDIDSMSKEKISQLLGEAPNEETPEWDTPGASSDTKIDMGNTVEDFERWRAHMRQEDRRKNGEPEAAESEVPRGNEVDNFFSFVKPKDASEKTPVPASATIKPDAKSSRFLSFFDGSPAAKLPVSNQPAPQEVKESSTKLLRFFSSDSLPGAPRDQHGHPQGPPQNVSGALPRGMPQGAQQGLPQGMQGPPQGMGQVPPQRLPQGGQQGVPQGFQGHFGGHMFPPQGPNGAKPPANMPHGGPPPGFGGPPGGMLPPMGGANDSFFLSLLKKREDGDGKGEMPGDVPRPAPAGQPSFPPQLDSPHNRPGQPPMGAVGGMARLNSGQGVAAGVGSPGQKVPPPFYNQGVPQAMRAPPPGMFPPGMFPMMQGPPGMMAPGQGLTKEMMEKNEVPMWMRQRMAGYPGYAPGNPERQ